MDQDRLGCFGLTTDTVRFDGDQLPVWHGPTGRYLDPATGELLPTWDEALDAIGPADEPRHVARFGAKFDAQGVIAGSKDAARCIGYLTKYLIKHVADCHETGTESRGKHVNRLADALWYEPCSPSCANWLRYGIQPWNPKPGLRPGYCKGKAHRREYLGYAGPRGPGFPQMVREDTRRPSHRPQSLAAGRPRHSRRKRRPVPWEVVNPSDPDHMPMPRRLLHVLAGRASWQAALTEARRRAQEATGDLSATGRAA